MDTYSLKECLSVLTEKYDVNFSYINDEIPLHQRIHCSFVNQPLKILLDSICNQSSIRYFIVGAQVVLKNIEQNMSVAVKDSVVIGAIYSAQVEAVVDTNLQSVRVKIVDKYQMNKKYRKYFFSVFGKRRVPDSLIVVSSNGLKDTIVEQEKKYRYVNRMYTHTRSSIGLFAGPGIAYRTLTGDDQRYVGERNSYEKSILNYFGGFQFTHYVQSLKVSFRSGMNYITLGENGTYTEIILVPPTQTSFIGGTPIPTAKKLEYSYQNRYSFLMLPVMIGYNFHANDRLCISIYSGMSFAFLLSEHSSYEQIGNRNQKLGNTNSNPFSHSYRDVNIILPIQVEISYQVTLRTQVFIAPTFNYFLTSIFTKNDISNQMLYAVNFSVGFNYFLKRT